MANSFSVEAVFRAVDRMTGPISRIQQRISQFTRSTETGLRLIDNSVDKMMGGLKRGAQAIGALSAAAVGVAAVADQLTQADVEAQRMAKSVGMNVDTLDALTAAIKPAGFEIDNVVDLMEELNNKIGESKGLEEITPVTESLAILGLEFEKISKLTPEDQFKAVANAALQMEDAQKAAAAADILMGGEANKVIGVLREQGGTIDDIIDKYAALSFRTEESRAGAEKFQRAMNLIKGVVGSVASEVAGLMGNAIEPLTNRMRDWVDANKDLIAQNIADFVQGLTDSITWLIDNFEQIVTWTKRIGIALGIFFVFVGVLKLLVLIMTAVNLVMAANPIVLIVLGIMALIAAVALLVFYWDEVIAAFKNFGVWIDYAIMAIAAFTGPIGWIVGIALVIYRNWESIGPMFAALWELIKAAFWAAVEWLLAGWEWLKAGWAAGVAAVTAVLDVLMAAWAVLVDFFAGLWAMILAGFEVLKSGIMAGVNVIINLAQRVMNGWGVIGGFFSNLWAGVKGAFASAAAFISSKVQWITDKARALISLKDKVAGFFGGGSGGAVTSSPVGRSGSNRYNSTVTINDNTRSGAVTSGKLGPGVRVARTGGM